MNYKYESVMCWLSWMWTFRDWRDDGFLPVARVVRHRR